MKLPAVLLLCLAGFLSAASDPPTKAPPGVTIQRDLSFLAPGRSEKLDLYTPEKRDADVRSPAVVIIPGANHAWPLKTSKFDLTGEVTAFFDRHLKRR